ncbi:MAG: TonB-dependent receptor [Pseudomonadota bacterium]
MYRVWLSPRVLRSAFVVGVVGAWGVTSSSAIQAQEIVLPGIVIVGELQDKTLLETTSSVSVFTDEALDNETGRTINGVVQSTPNVVVRSISETPVIRGIEGGGPGGIANTGLGGTLPRVPLVIDGVARPASIPNSDYNSLWDVKQLEVFKGPQTTLRGRAAIAGSIVVETKDPTFEPESAAQVITKFDEFHGPTFVFNGMVSSGIIPDKLAVRVTAEHTRGDDPREITDVPAGFEGQAEAATEFKQTRIRAKALLTPMGRTGPLQIKGLFEHQRSTTPQTRGTVQGPSFDDRTIQFNSGGIRIFDTSAWTSAIDGAYRFANGDEFQSITSYTTTRFNSTEDQPIVPSPLNAFFDFDERLFNQDLIFRLGDKSRRLGGLVGLSYTKRKQDIFLDNRSFPGARSESTGNSDTISAFADLRFALTSRFDLLAGGRVLRDRQERQNASNVLPFYLPATQTFEENETVLLPKIGLQYKIGNQQTIAGTVRRGWNAGGGLINFTTGVPYTYESETVWTYEAAYRFASQDKRYSFAATAFYNDYTNPQFFLERVPGNRFTIDVVNLPEGSSYGVEFEGKARVSPSLTLFGSLGLLRTEVTESISTNPALEGNRFGKDPNATVAAGFVYSPEVIPGLSFDAKFSYVGNYFNDFNNFEAEEVGGYGLVDLGLSYSWKGLEGRIFVQNLTDQVGQTAQVSGGTFAEVTPPRTFGVSVKAKF